MEKGLKNSTQTSNNESLERQMGMLKVSADNYEVWIHEDCAVWAPDVFLVGSQIIGIGSAVWSSCQYECSLCQKKGATISCRQRDCKMPAHVPCARAAQWSLDENTFWVYCRKHMPPTQSTTPSNSSTLLFLANSTSPSTSRAVSQQKGSNT